MVCQNDESDALMITSTFLPAALPPAPPPLELDDPPDARPPTTPTTSAMSTMTATSDSENFTRLLVMSLRPSPPRWTLSLGPPQIRGNVFSNWRHCRESRFACQENTFT
jgi:hypothetical protein